MDVRDRIPGFRYLFSAEVAVRPHTMGDTVLMEVKSARIYLNRATNYLHAVEPFRTSGEQLIRTVFDEDVHHLGADEPLVAPRSPEWIGLVSSGQSLVFISAKIRAAQEARENGLYWMPEDEALAPAQSPTDSDDDF